MRKNSVVFVLSLLLGGCLLIGCGADKNQKEAVNQKQETVDLKEETVNQKEEIVVPKEEAVNQTLEEIYTQMVENVEMPPMVRLDEEYITNYYGIDLTNFDEYVFAVAEDILLAENIILLKVKEGQSTEPVVTILEKIIKQKKAELENYIPEQFKIVEKSSVVTKDNYVILIISSNKSELEAQLPKALK